MEQIKTILRTINLPENKGLGNALKEALNHCSNDLVARMDSDDISYPYRFQAQLAAFLAHPMADVVGGTITEFVGEPDNITGERVVETENNAILLDMKKRCAMNHVSVMYKKSSVNKAGGYLDWHYNEDYYLWIRMMEAGCSFANVPYPLVNVRTGADMASRRGGMKYFMSEKGLQQYMLSHKMISFPRYVYNTLLRFGGEVAAPNALRTWLFKRMRKTYVPGPAPELPTLSGEIPPFSVATSVYAKDNPVWFDTALKSIITDQTVKPDEVVLVVDGPVPDEIKDVIEKYCQICGGVFP